MPRKTSLNQLGISLTREVQGTACESSRATGRRQEDYVRKDGSSAFRAESSHDADGLALEPDRRCRTQILRSPFVRGHELRDGQFTGVLAELLAGEALLAFLFYDFRMTNLKDEICPSMNSFGRGLQPMLLSSRRGPHRSPRCACPRHNRSSRSAIQRQLNGSASGITIMQRLTLPPQVHERRRLILDFMRRLHRHRRARPTTANSPRSTRRRVASSLESLPPSLPQGDSRKRFLSRLSESPGGRG